MTLQGACEKLVRMRFDIFPFESWDRTNSELARVWGAGATPESLHAHGGLAPALKETLTGLAQVYSHKRSIAVVKGNSWAIELMLPFFLREAYSIQSIAWSELMKDPEAWARDLKKDTAFVLFAEDHPLTGETWDWEAFDSLLNDLKHFSVRVSHHSFVAHREEVRPTSCRICSVDESLALAVMGSRFRSASDIVAYREWSPLREASRLRGRLSQKSDEKAILDFESLFGAERLLAAGKKRFFDRALLGFAGVGGDALIGRVAEKTGSREGLIPFQPCHWESVRLYKAWWLNKPSDEVLRGALAVSLDRVQRKDFAKLLRESYEELRGLQSW